MDIPGLGGEDTAQSGGNEKMAQVQLSPPATRADRDQSPAEAIAAALNSEQDSGSTAVDPEKVALEALQAGPMLKGSAGSLLDSTFSKLPQGEAADLEREAEAAMLVKVTQNASNVEQDSISVDLSTAVQTPVENAQILVQESPVMPTEAVEINQAETSKQPKEEQGASSTSVAEQVSVDLSTAVETDKGSQESETASPQKESQADQEESEESSSSEDEDPTKLSYSQSVPQAMDIYHEGEVNDLDHVSQLMAQSYANPEFQQEQAVTTIQVVSIDGEGTESIGSQDTTFKETENASQQSVAENSNLKSTDADSDEESEEGELREDEATVNGADQDLSSESEDSDPELDEHLAKVQGSKKQAEGSNEEDGEVSDDDEELEAPPKKKAKNASEFPFAQEYAKLSIPEVDEQNLKPAGQILRVFAPFTSMVTALPLSDSQAIGLDNKTILFRYSGQAVGLISDVLGKFEEPQYVMQNQEEAKLEEGESLYYSTNPEHVHYILPDHVKRAKHQTSEGEATDASEDGDWEGDWQDVDDPAGDARRQEEKKAQNKWKQERQERKQRKKREREERRQMGGPVMDNKKSRGMFGQPEDPTMGEAKARGMLVSYGDLYGDPNGTQGGGPTGRKRSRNKHAKGSQGQQAAGMQPGFGLPGQQPMPGNWPNRGNLALPGQPFDEPPSGFGKKGKNRRRGGNSPGKKFRGKKGQFANVGMQGVHPAASMQGNGAHGAASAGNPRHFGGARGQTQGPGQHTPDVQPPPNGAYGYYGMNGGPGVNQAWSQAPMEMGMEQYPMMGSGMQYGYGMPGQGHPWGYPQAGMQRPPMQGMSPMPNMGTRPGIPAAGQAFGDGSANGPRRTSYGGQGTPSQAPMAGQSTYSPQPPAGSSFARQQQPQSDAANQAPGSGAAELLVKLLQTNPKEQQQFLGLLATALKQGGNETSAGQDTSAGWP